MGVVDREADGTCLFAESTAGNLTDDTSAVPIEFVVVRGGVIEYPLTLATNATANDPPRRPGTRRGHASV